MQSTTDTRPETTAPHATTDTGAGAQASTAATAPFTAAPLSAEYYAARLRYLQAQLQRARAQEAEHSALVAMYRAAHHASDGDRHMLATLAECDAQTAHASAVRVEQLIADLLREHPEALQAVEPYAVVSITIRRDEITTRATLHMGHQFHAQQTERRQSQMFWRGVDPEWITHENTLGIELVEFLDGIDLPLRVADMLPRAPTPAGLAAAAEAAAVLRA